MAKSMWARGPGWTFTDSCQTETASTFSLRPQPIANGQDHREETGLSHIGHSASGLVLAIRPQRISIVARLEAPTVGDSAWTGIIVTPEKAQLSRSGDFAQNP